MLLAKDIMTTTIVTARREMSIFKAAELMEINHISGLPIIDQDNKLVGILSEYDVLRMLKEATPDQEKRVADFMTEYVVSFEENTPMIQVWAFFIDNPTKRRVPIVREGKLIGVISRGDIMREILKLHRA